MRDLTRARPARFEPLDGKVGRLGTTQNPTDVIVSAPKSTLIGSNRGRGSARIPSTSDHRLQRPP
jgi:hypothetical protein